MSPSLPPRSGDTVGPWKLGPLLGQGGIAAVYRGQGPRGVAAVKVLLAGRVTEEEVVRFRREFLTLQRLRHPGLVRVYDAGEERGFPWIAMELVEGSDLGALLERWESDPPQDRHARAERILADLCEVLVEVHAQGVVHRDIKPGNILIDAAGRARLTDFGAMKDPDAFPTSLTRAGKLVGTVAFMAPEQILGDAAVDARADLYSLGAVFYTLLTGKRPIQADSIAGYLARHLSETPRPPTDVDARVPPRLERVCMRLLEKEPARRFPDARAVLRAVQGSDDPAPRTLHGRTSELSTLEAGLQRLAQRGIGGCVALRGPEGSGRSRMLEEAALIAGGFPDIGVVRATGRSLLADLSRAWAPEDDPATGTELGERVTSVGVQGEVARLRRGLAGGRWALLVDDVDGAGPGATAVLAGLVRAEVAQEGGALLVVVTAPEAGAASLVSGTATGMPAEVITLGPLDREAIRGLLREAGIPGPAGSVLARRLCEEAGGLPGPALEQLATLELAGWMGAGEGGARKLLVPLEVLRSDPLPLPETVRAAELQRLERLSEATRAALEGLAVLDGPASALLLAGVCGSGEGPLTDQLRELVRSGHVRVHQEGLQEAYGFARPRAAQALRESMPPARRGALHRAASEALLRIHRRRASAVAEEAASHLLRAGDAAGAWPLFVQAAQRAARLGDWSAARRLSEQAAACEGAGSATVAPAESLRTRRQLAQVRGEVARATGQLTEASRALRGALQLAREEGDRAAIARAATGAGLAEAMAGRLEPSRSLLEEAWTHLEQGDPAWPELADAVGASRLHAGDPAGAHAAWTALDAFGREARSVPAMLLGVGGLARISAFQGKDAEAAERLEEALQRGREAPGAEVPWARAAQLAATWALERGDASRACRMADELEAVAERDALAGAWSFAIRAEALAQLGDTLLAQRTARELLGRLRVGGPASPRHLGVWAGAVRVLADNGEAVAAIDRLAEPLWAIEPGAPEEPTRLALLALALAPTRPVEARSYALAALAPRIAPGERPACRARAELDAARALARVGAPDDARAALLAALGRLNDVTQRAWLREAAALARALPALPEAVARRLAEASSR